jgi:hypothetical protein
MKLLLLILLAVTFHSCKNGQSEQINFSNGAPFRRERLQDDLFYSIVYLDSPYYKIKWGHKAIDTLITDSTYSLLGSGPAGYLTSNRSGIFLEQECGTSCNYLIVLPFNKTVKPKLYFEFIAIDTANDLIAYVTEDEPSFFAIENFLNSNRIKIAEENTCKSAVKFSCIDSCYFDSAFFYVRWHGENYDGSKNPDWMVKKYSTKELIK